MGVRSELFTTRVNLENRTYFFNVKENRNGDIFLQIVESKPSERSAEFNRMQIAVFADDMQKFLSGLDESLGYIEKERSKRTQNKIPIKKIKKRETQEHPSDGIKRTGKVIHIASKKE